MRSANVGLLSFCLTTGGVSDNDPRYNGTSTESAGAREITVLCLPPRKPKAGFTTRGLGRVITAVHVDTNSNYYHLHTYGRMVVKSDSVFKNSNFLRKNISFVSSGVQQTRTLINYYRCHFFCSSYD